jgi:SAM-dependent methyltransferase
VCGLGLRKAIKVLEFLNVQFHLGLKDIPCPNSIKGWIEKSGYYTYTHSELKSSHIPYAGIVDESMQIGSEKLLLSLGVKADKTDELPLRMNDVEILDISVAKSWNSGLICNRLKEIEENMGVAPDYVISDNASIMNKGIRDSSLIHLRDVGHTLAMFLERQYKDASDFLSFMKDLAKVKNREVMRPIAYLLPPKQRIIARFMNLTPCLVWAEKMLHHFDALSKEEQQVFKFLKKYSILIQEMSGIIHVFNRISQLMKEKGLSHESVQKSIRELIPLTVSPFPRVLQAAKECIRYLNQEADKLGTQESVWHISSDIIETIFGVYKERKSPNKLNGVTSYVLMLPLLTKSNPESNCCSIDFKKSLESVFLRDIDTWEKDKLSENLVVKRRRKLKVA